LNAVADGNKNSGGLHKVLTAWGIIGINFFIMVNIGFIRFTAGYYMSVITKRSPVALLGGHYVYHIDETRLISISNDDLRKTDRNPEEGRYLSTLDHLDISKTFYFSYSYDITRTLQSNILHQRNLFEQGKWYGSDAEAMSYNDMFVWNHFLLQSGEKQPREMAHWCLPIIHGFVDQASIFLFNLVDVEISLYGRSIYVCVIARRSRYFAGARFLKRGVNDKVPPRESISYVRDT
jgi:phosphatidylinositol 3,5-bisphosphate 5-phosphatase